MTFKKRYLWYLWFLAVLLCIWRVWFVFGRGVPSPKPPSEFVYGLMPDSKGVELISYKGISSEVVIPKKYKNNRGKMQKVEGIGKNAIYHQFPMRDDPKIVTKVILPKSIKNIAAYAFSQCVNLAEINLPKGLLSIGDLAFRGCGSLTAISIPKSVTNIGGGAFSECCGLESIEVSSKNPVYKGDGNCIITRADSTLIAGCQNSVIPEGVIRIGALAFNGHTGLTSIVIPEGVVSVGAYAFSNCSGLTSVEIPPSVVSIEDYAFSWCESLIDFKIPDTVSHVGMGMDNYYERKEGPSFFDYGCEVEWGDDFWEFEDDPPLVIEYVPREDW